MDDKLALRVSQAGMRFIAQMTIYNSGDFERLRKYIEESYHPDMLAQESVEDRIAIFREQYDRIGKVRIKQVVGGGKHHVIVVLGTEREEGYLVNEMQVEEDYPHRIIVFGDVEE
ncbi:MAG: hypothetical protein ABI579_09650 [Candidatus Sumerlaeota bacterium]